MEILLTKDSGRLIGMNNIIKHIIFWVIIGILVAAMVAFIGMEIYAWVNYGDKPITEIPYWAVFIIGK